MQRLTSPSSALSRTLYPRTTLTSALPRHAHSTAPLSSQPASTPRTEVLDLYRSILRSSRLFETYNYREYVRRRAHDAFRAHKDESDPGRIAELVAKGKKDLEVVRRQGWINKQFAGGEKTVVELEGR
ncbi:hypothetical protein HDV00_006419 [Rhizophlyctis rosea]|nr:hypothetical protein HDV00_006419 [Rhizophlyctis rosea]